MGKITGLTNTKLNSFDVLADEYTEEMEVLASVHTGGIVNHGYSNDETLGVVRTDSGNLGLFVGDTESEDDMFPMFVGGVITLGKSNKNLSTILRELADECEALE